MRFVVLSRSRFLYTTRNLVAEAKLRKHDVRVAAPHECLLLLSGGQGRLLHRGKLPTSADVLIPRLAPEDFDHGLAVLRVLERMGVPMLNGPEPLALARDRFHTAMALVGLALPVPPTTLVPDAESLAAAVEGLGGLPVQLRPVHQGPGRSLLLEQPTTLEAVTALAWEHGSRFVLQRVTGAAREVRLYVCGGECLGAVLRRPQWLKPAGIKAGAPIEAPETLRRLALRVVEGLGLAAASVDMIETHAGPQIVEVDATPNLRGIDKAVRAATVSAMIRRAEALGVARIPV
ncbi:MAG: hypothetical protein HS108_05675 [Planctomycetes bacterium]|jgi:ribosomal protein S6--L-glutamate ligase|nr:hypothetical protein [Planctomycetota bacterium]MCL4730692.1 hypothetical protein [Planctomycetota bacterium]